jgi:hypothetical protein
VIRLWHDDVRQPPDGDDWVWAKTNAEAMWYLAAGGIVEASLDHDLGAIPTGDPQDVYLKGDAEETGLDLVRWMVENGRVPATVRIHSWNPDGAMAMARTLDDAGYPVLIDPYVAKEAPR